MGLGERFYELYEKYRDGAKDVVISRFSCRDLTCTEPDLASIQRDLWKAVWDRIAHFSIGAYGPGTVYRLAAQIADAWIDSRDSRP